MVQRGLREIFLNVVALPLANTWRCTWEHCVRVFLVCDYHRIPGFLRTPVFMRCECDLNMCACVQVIARACVRRGCTCYGR